MLAIRRLIARLLLAPVLAFGWGFAQPHVHPGEHDHEGGQVLHQHLAPHLLSARKHHSTESFEAADDDDDAVWLNGATTVSTSFALSAPIAAPVVVAPGEPTLPSWFPKTREAAAPAHGPPRTAASHRGPPSSCLI